MIEDVVISICIIGRNEADNLLRLSKSLDCLSKYDLNYETIYIDSASQDNSLEIASNSFDVVYSFKESKNLCASLARYWGTKIAKGEWILYMDGDMSLDEEFISWWSGILKSGEIRYSGYIGRYVNIYPDGTSRIDVLGQKNINAVVKKFGGAVLLRRDIALSCGNWNPYLYSNEEMEFYMRLSEQGNYIYHCDVNFIFHHTKKIPHVKMFFYNLFPFKKGLGKKFFGFGQVVVSACKSGKFSKLLSWCHEPFLLWFAMIVAFLIFYFTGMVISPFILFALICIYIMKARGHKFLILSFLMLFQTISGIFFYQDKVLDEPTKI